MYMSQTPIGQQLVELLRESILIQAFITAFVVVTMCIMYLTGRPIPDTFQLVASIVIGFYFGQRSAARADSVLTKANQLANNPNSDNSIEKSK